MIQSFYDGTWGGDLPREIADYELARETHMSWQELQELPIYVHRVWWDCMVARRAAQAAENDVSAQSHNKHGQEVVRVRR